MRHLLFAGVLLLQAAVIAHPERPLEPPPDPVAAAPLALAAAAVVEPGDGTPAGALGSRAAWPVGSRVQLTFAPEQESWTAVLWFDGPDTVVPLYPVFAAGETGWTDAAAPYVVPGEGRYLRLTTTAGDGDALVVVTSRRPDPEVERVLLNPQPADVRRLREALLAEAAARAPGLVPVAAERFLPTPDGRAVPVPWRRAVGEGRVAVAWEIHAG